MDAAERPQRRARSSLVASDFTLPRSRRRASSPGARSELSSRSRRVRRRLVRSGDRPQPERAFSGSQRLGSDGDSILNALERSISARDHAGLSTTAEHRSPFAAIQNNCSAYRSPLNPVCSMPGSTCIVKPCCRLLHSRRLICICVPYPMSQHQ